MTNVSQLDFYRHEVLHAAFMIRENLNDFVDQTHYRDLVNNPSLDKALQKAHAALYEVYMAICEECEE